MSNDVVFDDGRVRLHCADALAVMGDLPDRSVDLILTDPPYNISAGQDSRDVRFDDRADMKRQFGEWDKVEWQPQPFLDAAVRLLRRGGSLLSFSSDRLLSAYRSHAGLHQRGTIVWQKANPAPAARPGYVSATEWIVWLQKPGAKATWNGDGMVLNIRYFPVCSGLERTNHPTQKPEDLITDLLARHSNPDDLVLDPFAGSGTTLAVAKRLNRRAIGVEIERQWCEVAIKRLAQGGLDLRHNTQPPKQVTLGFDQG